MSRPGGNAGLLSDRQVDIIAARLAERMSGARAATPTPAATTAAPRRTSPSAPREALGDGVFATVDDAVDAADVLLKYHRSRLVSHGIGFGCQPIRCHCLPAM